MEKHTLNQKLYVIAFEITTPLVGLGGFCDLAKNRTQSQPVLNHLMSMMDSVDQIKAKKDSFLEKVRTTTDPDFSSSKKAVTYIRKFASELQEHEDLIISSVNKLRDISWGDSDQNFDEWAKIFLTKTAKNLSEKLDALRNIQPDLELIIQGE